MDINQPCTVVFGHSKKGGEGKSRHNILAKRSNFYLSRVGKVAGLEKAPNF